MSGVLSPAPIGTAAGGAATWYPWCVSISSLQDLLADFAERRDWEQFHTPKNLAMALTGEAGELAAEFQWLTPEQAVAVMSDPAKAEAVRLEMADVFSYLLRLATVLDVDLAQSVRDKVAINETRFPEKLRDHGRRVGERVGEQGEQRQHDRRQEQEL